MRHTKTTMLWVFYTFSVSLREEEFFGVESIFYSRVVRRELNSGDTNSLWRSTTHGSGEDESKPDKIRCDIRQVHRTYSVNVDVAL